MIPTPQFSRHSEISKTPALANSNTFRAVTGCVYKCRAGSRYSVTASYNKGRSGSIVVVIVVILLITSPYLSLLEVMLITPGWQIYGLYTASLIPHHGDVANRSSIHSFKLGQYRRILVITVPGQHYQPTRAGT